MEFFIIGTSIVAPPSNMKSNARHTIAIQPGIFSIRSLHAIVSAALFKWLARKGCEKISPA